MAVFLLFLHHPEGIRFKELPDYYHELLKIYQTLNPIGGQMRQEQSIRDVTDLVTIASMRNVPESARHLLKTLMTDSPKTITLQENVVSPNG